MNKFLVIAKGVIIVMGMVGIAHANNNALDNSVNNWTGFYAGANGGFSFNNAKVKSQQLAFTNPNEACNTTSDYSTFSPGIQLGYLYKFSNAYVTGIEANATVNIDQKDRLGCTSEFNSAVYDRFTFRNQMQTSIKGRVGRDLNWNNNTLLPYLTGGASFARVGLTYKNEGEDYYSNNNTQVGWLLGAGIEWAFQKQWSVRAEYYYLAYGKIISLKIPNLYGLEDPNGKAHINLSSNNVVVALNYWI